MLVGRELDKNKILIISIMSSFSFLKPANQLWKDAKIAKVHKRILERITDMPHEIRANKHNMELLSLICNMIENSGIKNSEKNAKLKIDKKLLLITIYKSLYGNLTADDVEILSKNIEFLHDNQHIVSHPWYRLVSSCVVDWFKRKVLWIIQYIKDYVREKIQDWLVDKFLKEIKASKRSAYLITSLLSLDASFIIKLILNKYGLGYLFNYILLFTIF